MTPYPIRKIIEWTLNQKSGQWHALFECNHRANFGAGPKPTLREYACAACPPREPEAA